MKTQYIKYLLLTYLCVFGITSAFAERSVPGATRKEGAGYRTSEACSPPSASSELSINNVKCLLHNGGDAWWDLVGNPRYEIPKGSNRHALFASSLWIGGVDATGQMRVAAQTYRQDGYDFWPGPLTTGSASVDDVTCNTWNKMYKVTRSQIDELRASTNKGEVLGKYPDLKDWPAYGKDADGNNVQATLPGKNANGGDQIYLAPFIDVDGDLKYDAAAGDYPDIKGDEAVWWVINDKGNVHTATGGQPIGIEIHMMAFAFTASNAINNMTFYDQIVINRSSLVLTDTYMGQWVDADLGNYADDYVGCDTTRGLGFCYNGDNDDEGATGYGPNPPAVGVDFFQGPLADPNDNKDNDKDGIIDEDGEKIIMSKFVYYNNDWSLNGNPEVAVHYYNYLKGIWKDGTEMVANGKNGYAATADGPATSYMFPGSVCAGQGWTETSAGNKAADRRFLQSAGPFTLLPGAVNEVITGVLWARGASNVESVCQLQIADDVAQALFDANFDLLDGPNQPPVVSNEYDKKLILSWGYDPVKDKNNNNYNESYIEADPILKNRNIADSLFAFEGYLVFQLADNTVNGVNDLFDADKAKLVAQCDIKNGVGAIKNTVTQSVGGTPVTVEELMVQGEDKGLFRSVAITEDKFSISADRTLKNYTPYYFAVIAYAFNDVTSDGRQFVPSKNFTRIKAMPHPVQMENGGTVITGTYGDGIAITQTSGVANGGNFVQITAATESNIVSPPYKTSEISYLPGKAPINVKVISPKDVKQGNYDVKVFGVGHKTVKRNYPLGSTDPLTTLFVDSDSVLATQKTGTDSTGGLDTWTFLVINPKQKVSVTKVFSGVYDIRLKDWELSYNAGSGSNIIYTSVYSLRNNMTAVARPTPMTGMDQAIPDHGIAIAVKDAAPAGYYKNDKTLNSGVIGDTVIVQDPTKSWLAGLADNDDLGGGIWDWVLAGDTTKNNRNYKPDYIFDGDEDFEGFVGGRWAPYCLAKQFAPPHDGGTVDVTPGITIQPANAPLTSTAGLPANYFQNLRSIPDVDIVFTKDESKWSRCVVVEASATAEVGSGSWPLTAKWAANVDKSGNKEAGTPAEGNHGMGWFPGYAIDINTGQRLAVFFAESTWDRDNRGDDMIFNPTSSYGSALERVGGRHFVYVTNLPYDENFPQTLKDTLMCGLGKPIKPDTWGGIKLADGTTRNLNNVYRYVTWAGIPMTSFGYDILDPHDIPSDVRISLRVNQPYRQRKGENNDYLATYKFSTTDRAAKNNVNETAVSALDMIRVVPNPYYAYSSYEAAQLDNQVKITNLPKECTISIYTLNGHLVKTYNKNSPLTEQVWDLKNQSGVSVASGVYIVHIDAPGVGEKIVKMLAIMRQTDLNSY
ncbi:MAG: T9SS type A sorting domain-containing protein [Bacteroidia bacterium]